MKEPKTVRLWQQKQTSLLRTSLCGCPYSMDRVSTAMSISLACSACCSSKVGEVKYRRTKSIGLLL
jgi:hypothetical protein